MTGLPPLSANLCNLRNLWIDINLLLNVVLFLELSAILRV